MLKHIVLAMTISVAIITPAQAIDINIPGADKKAGCTVAAAGFP